MVAIFATVVSCRSSPSLKSVCYMPADSRLVNAKELSHCFLRGPYCFIFNHYLYSTFFVGQLVQEELYFVAHISLNRII